jgi:hypothetical protein
LYILLPVRWLKVNGLAIFPFIFTQKKTKNKILINHELIHHHQQIELLYVPFFVWYLGEYAIKWMHYRNKEKAYRAISFEREAYTHDQDLNYLKNRSFWAFLKYI